MKIEGNCWVNGEYILNRYKPTIEGKEIASTIKILIKNGKTRQIPIEPNTEITTKIRKIIFEKNLIR